MKIKFVIILVLAAFVLAVILLQPGSRAAGAKTTYVCPMHPQVVQDRGGSCPICGMDLVPLGKQEGDEGEGNAVEEGADRVKVYISPYKRQLINIKLEQAEYRTLEKTVAAPGNVAYDPELYSAQLDYITALKAGGTEEYGIAGSLKETAAQKLRSLGLSVNDIKALGKTKEADKSLISEDDSGRVAVYARVYQEDIPAVKAGARAVISSATSDEEVFYGTVTAVDTVLNMETRSARVRIRVENSRGRLMPGMFVNVKILTGEGVFLCVPEEAVIPAGGKNIIFVSDDSGHFEPREITSGGKAGGYYIVEKGVKDGETVVVNGNFLVDSESRLKAAVANMGVRSH